MGFFMLPLLGLIAGVMSGLVGIGGGIVIVPALVYLFGYSQHMAQGTTLALMVPPIGLLAAWTYYRNGSVDLQAAILICCGFVLGGWLGGKWANNLPAEMLTRVFGVFLLVIALRMIAGR